MPPKRKPRHLDAIRIEVNDTERELIQQAIIANGVSGVARGLGTAVGGLGLALGVVAGVVIWKEGMDWFSDKMEQGKKEWLEENCSQEKYDAYSQARQVRWTASGSDMTFFDWEAANYPNQPLLLYDAWCNEKRRQETLKRRALVGTFFPPLNLIGIAQYGFKDWFSGKG